jgi:hypothetical protein
MDASCHPAGFVCTKASTAGAVNTDDATSQEQAASVEKCLKGGDKQEGTAPEIVTDRDPLNPEARDAHVGVVGMDTTGDATDLPTKMTDNATAVSWSCQSFPRREKTPQLDLMREHHTRRVKPQRLHVPQ